MTNQPPDIIYDVRKYILHCNTKELRLCSDNLSQIE